MKRCEGCDKLDFFERKANARHEQMRALGRALLKVAQAATLDEAKDIAEHAYAREFKGFR